MAMKKHLQELYNDCDPDLPPRGATCLACGQPCTPKRVDYGVGRIEVHGVLANNHDWQWESPCCEAGVEY